MSQTEDPSEEDLDRNLVEQLDVLKPLLDKNRIHESHYSADVTLAGLAADAWEAANALLIIIRDGRYVSAAYPIARLALEIGMDAHFLADHPNYDEAGAKARVFERFEYADLRADLGAAFGVEGFSSWREEYAAAETALLAEAERWDRASQGRGDLLRAALQHFKPKFEGFRAKSNRHPGNWTELSRRQVARELEKRNNKEGIADRLTAAYSSLSRSSHPRFRPETWQPTGATLGPLWVRRHGSARVALQMTLLGVSLVIESLEIVRARWEPSGGSSDGQNPQDGRP